MSLLGPLRPPLTANAEARLWQPVARDVVPPVVEPSPLKCNQKILKIGALARSAGHQDWRERETPPQGVRSTLAGVLHRARQSAYGRLRVNGGPKLYVDIEGSGRRIQGVRP